MEDIEAACQTTGSSPAPRQSTENLDHESTNCSPTLRR
jgi:hypothetical protein